MTIYSQHPNRGKVQALATFRGPTGVVSSTVTSIDDTMLAAQIVDALNRISACATVPVSVYDERDDGFNHYPRTHLAALTDQSARPALLKGAHSLWYENSMQLLHTALTDLDKALVDAPAPVRTAVTAELTTEARWLSDALAEYYEGTDVPHEESPRRWDFQAPFVAFDGGMDALSSECRTRLDHRENGASAEALGRGIDGLRLLTETYERCKNEDAVLDLTELTITHDPLGADRYYLTVDAPTPNERFRRAGWEVAIGRWDNDLNDPENDEWDATGESQLSCASAVPPAASDLVELLNLSGAQPEILTRWAKTPVGEALSGTAFIVTTRYSG